MASQMDELHIARELTKANQDLAERCCLLEQKLGESERECSMLRKDLLNMEEGTYETGCRPTCVASAEKEVILKKLKQSIGSKKLLKQRIRELEDEVETAHYQLQEQKARSQQPESHALLNTGGERGTREAELRGRLEAAQQWGDEGKILELQQELSTLQATEPEPDERLTLMEFRLEEAQRTAEEFQKTQANLISNLEEQIKNRNTELERTQQTLHNATRRYAEETDQLKDTAQTTETKVAILNAKIEEQAVANEELQKTIQLHVKTKTPVNPVYADGKKHRSCVTPPVNEASPGKCVLVSRHASPLRPSSNVNRPVLKLRSQNTKSPSPAPSTASIFSLPLNPPPTLIYNEATADAYSPKKFSSPVVHASSLYRRPKKGTEEGTPSYYDA
eukprot:TRINITY_DN37360_c0_g1_i1.p1 TRINITY_DN37360_c0_g1~~TRINITY_DN37360_c0_g1_i1.p1  ORF type:complete len:392 (+),score=62.49 TRINITY_DN37360_c0_g1_i1:31-1206(+)